MATNPEGGGLFGFLKKIFRKEAQKRLPPEMTLPRGSRIKDRDDKKENAELVFNELRNITPQHQAYEVLKGINFDQRTLSTNPELTNLVLNIIHTPDPNVYHSPQWLESTRDRLQQVRGTLAAAPTEQATLGNLEQTVNALYQRADANQRRIELEKERKMDEWLPEEEKRQIREKERISGGTPATIIPTPEVSWETAVNDLPDDDNIRKVKQASQIISNSEQGRGDLGQRGEGWWGDIESGFINAEKELVKRYSKTNDPNAKTAYETILKAHEKAARHYVETHRSEKGRLYEALRQHGGELVEKQIIDDQNYMDYWFYHIMEPILYNQRAESHRELYNLYVAGDMDLFLDIVRRKKDFDGNKIGLKFANRYTILKNAIFQAHDMDYYAAHPSQDMKEFIGSTSLFQNTYMDATQQDPLVNLAKRMYETTLFEIRETNNGYIPREWLQWEEGKLRASKLEELVEQRVKEAIDAGQLYHLQLDPITGLPAPSIWGRKQIDKTRPFTLKELYGYESPLSDEYNQNLGDLKIAAALKQAKGLGLVDMRFLEIIGRSRGTGSDYIYNKKNKFDLSQEQFNSVPYEGIVRHIEPLIHYYTRYKVGFEYYDGFFNMMINDDPKASWDPHLMSKVIQLQQKGDEEELKKFTKKHNMGDLGTRLLEQDNPFQFSGMWGPSTGWRVGDASIGFDDWEKDQAYATAVKITATAGKWAEQKARRYYIEIKNKKIYEGYRKEYRAKLLNSDNMRLREIARKDMELEGSGRIDDEFERTWRKVGILEKKHGREESYNDLLDQLWTPHFDEHKKIKGEGKELVAKLQKAYIARNWIKAAVRAPLIVARELDVAWNKAGFDQGKTPLRRKIIWEILGLDVDEVAAMRTPLSHEEAAFNRIAELEGAVAIASQISIRENRDLVDTDFDRIPNDILRKNAKEYWHKVKKSMMGDKNPEEIYRLLGIEDAPSDSNMQGHRFHKVSYDTINKNIDVTGKADAPIDKWKATKLPFESELLNKNLINREWRFLFSTEDMGWEYLNIGALGERNPVRRAGDLASHVQFGQEFEKYITENIIARPEIKDLVKQQKVMWEAMAGDFADIASDAVGRIAYITSKMYQKADISWKIPFLSPVISIFKDSSIMQIIRGRDRADAWGPNDMLHYNQAVGGLQIVPKRQYSGLGGREIAPGSQWTGARLSKLNGGTKQNAVIEIINMTLLIATLLTMWRALTAKSEEE